MCLDGIHFVVGWTRPSLWWVVGLLSLWWAAGEQDRMHLDCVFSIISDNVCIMMDEMMGKDSPTRRLVDEWTQDQVCLPV